MSISLKLKSPDYLNSKIVKKKKIWTNKRIRSKSNIKTKIIWINLNIFSNYSINEKCMISFITTRLSQVEKANGY